MNMKTTSISLLIILILLGGCEDGPTDTPPDDTDTTVTILKSAKRGISYNLIDAADLDTLKRGVSWWYKKNEDH